MKPKIDASTKRMFAQFLGVFNKASDNAKAKKTESQGYAIELIEDFADNSFNPYLFFEKVLLDRARKGDGGDGRVISLAQETLTATREELCKHNAKYFAELFKHHGPAAVKEADVDDEGEADEE